MHRRRNVISGGGTGQKDYAEALVSPTRRMDSHWLGRCRHAGFADTHRTPSGRGGETCGRANRGGGVLTFRSVSALGSVTAFNTVTVRPRVDGQLVHVSSREGQFVKQGDQLAQIDPRPFQVQLEQAVRWMPSIARAPRISRAGRCSPSITRSIMELLRVKTNAELVQQAIKLGLLAP